MKPKTCIFCDIIHNKASAFKFWENEHHLAFLSIYPNTPGVSVVVPKVHYSSDAFSLPQSVLVNLILAAQEVSSILTQKLVGVGRTALVLEGFGVDHVHAKLYPMHGTKKYSEEPWQPIKSQLDAFFPQYPGYISSHDSTRCSLSQIENVYQMLICD